MAKTYEAMMKAEEEAQKKQAAREAVSPDRGLVSDESGPSSAASELSSSENRGPSTVDRGPVSTDRGLASASDRGPSTVDRGLLSASGRGPSTVDGGLSLDEYYRLKQNILRASENGKIKSLLFLSPTGGEGASTVLVEFGTALAGQGEKVLLIDTNFRSPSLHKIFGLEMENGLTDLFLQRRTLKEVIKGTGFNNLFVITSGGGLSSSDRGPSTVDRGLFSNEGGLSSTDRGPSTADRGLSSSGRGLSTVDCGLFLTGVKEEADWVLFDGPPVNQLDEGLALSGKVDGVVMVLQAEKTRWEVAQAAKQRLEESGGKILGVVLNKRKFYIPKWIYRTL